jgi:hypothetical protein
MTYTESHAGRLPLNPSLIRTDVLLMTSASRHQVVHPEQVGNLALPPSVVRIPGQYTATSSHIVENPGVTRSELMIRDVNDPSFIVEASSVQERQKGILGAKRFSDKLAANAGSDALVLAAYADVLREKERTARFQLKLELSLPKELYWESGFAETLGEATHSQAARAAGVRALAGFERPTSIVTVNSSLMEGIAAQRGFLYRAFSAESVDAALTRLYGAHPANALQLYYDALAGNSDAYNAAFAVKRSLPSAANVSNLL